MSRVSPCSSWKQTVCGNPVIGGRTGGIPEAIVDGKAGFLVEPQSVANIAERLATILTDHELAATGRGWVNLRRALTARTTKQIRSPQRSEKASRICSRNQLVSR